MRIAFSRKGFDTANGGFPSPLVEGRPVSLPIPTRGPSATRFGDLGAARMALVSDLARGRFGPDRHCHLDPDIEEAALPARPPGWRGALGRAGAAQTHLAHQGVGEGDLFLFWGLFRPARRGADGAWRFEGEAEHRLFGWLRVGAVLRPGADGDGALATHPWLRDHPHARAGWPANNTIYLAAERLGLPGTPDGLPGWGLFPQGRRLTAPGRRASVWLVPAWLDPLRGGTGLSFHAAPERWREAGVLAGVARGQEFVADATGREDAAAWLAGLWQADGG